MFYEKAEGWRMYIENANRRRIVHIQHKARKIASNEILASDKHILTVVGKYCNSFPL